MPQEKYISRQQADLHELNPKYRMPSDTFTTKSIPKGTPKKAAARASVDARNLSASQTVTARDAANVAKARTTLAGRSSVSKAQPRGGGILANPMLGIAAGIAEADKATDYKRVKYSGNFGGPSFSVNPYASSNKPAYNGQSNVSKLMGVGRKK
jgi:hypothetical protein